ncbi:ABC transporter substrate-binding protein [Streptomyces anulatus]|uniref:ABC transporter substrate-binding protein n=1 Tax=Streptomyces anulatus TaxID=1892 RepID=UPI002E7FCC64|nr:ABC transporter substrate-binding protein [Streptomyces anulatus]WUC91065.1 ABC transporter substrate-binding protein [Streptomyces anulatus]
MSSSIRVRRARRASLLATAAATALLLSGCSGAGASGAADTSGKQLLTIPREDFATFTRNFNPFAPGQVVAPLTSQAVYEAMLVYNPADGKTTPWLATSWETAPDGKTLTFTLRPGVKWSDGKPLTAEDVAYTFALQKKLLGGYEYLESARAEGAGKVVFTLNKPYSPGVFELGKQIIVPKHVWEKVKDPAKETNPDPVGTGPYTQVAAFQSQSYELRRNPEYWQPDKQAVEGIRVLGFSGNDSANLAFVNGEADWTQSFIPDVAKSFVAKNPEHNKYWYPRTGSLVEWTMNTTRAPFDDVAVRKALSRAVDRESVTKVGMNGYTEPADCTGLSGGYDKWRDTSLAKSCTWTKHDAAAAGKALDAAGYRKGEDGKRTLKNGKPFAFDISVGSASSDWLSVANIIKQNLADIGVTATVKSPDWAAVVSGYETGDYDTGIVWSDNGATPYQFYRNTLGTGSVKPVGTRALNNYHRFGTKKADALLDTFAASSDEAGQREQIDALQRLFDEQAPVVPLFPGPEWGSYTDTRFTGWPTEDNPYATLTNRGDTTVLVLTSLKPVKR